MVMITAGPTADRMAEITYANCEKQAQAAKATQAAQSQLVTLTDNRFEFESA